MLYDLSKPEEIRLLKKRLNIFYKKGFKVNLEVWHTKRDHTQNKFIWVLNTLIGIDLGYTKEDTHELLKDLYIEKYPELIKKKILKDRKITINFSTSALNKQEFNRYIEFVLDWAGLQAIDLPQSINEWKQNEIEIDRIIKQNEFV